MDLADLGMTQDELQQRVVASCADRLLTTFSVDDENVAYPRESKLKAAIKAEVWERIRKTVERNCEDEFQPRVDAYFESLLVPCTNKFGEKKGEPMTFMEYVTAAIDKYLAEAVDKDGRSREEASSRGVSFRKHRTRLEHVVDVQLTDRIHDLTKEAVQNISQTAGDRLIDAVKAELDRLSSSLTVAIKAK